MGQAADRGARRDVPRGGGRIPLDGGGPTKVGTLLREAIEKVNKGEYGGAVTAARRTIDAMGGGWASEKNIVSVAKAQRSLVSAFPFSGMPCTAWRTRLRTVTLSRTRSTGTGPRRWRLSPACLH